MAIQPKKSSPLSPYWQTVAWAAGIYLFVLLVALLSTVIHSSFPKSADLLIFSVMFRCLVVLLTIYYITSIVAVQEKERSGYFLFQRYVGELNSGMYLILRGIGELPTIPKETIEVQFPDDPEKIFKGPDDAPLPSGMQRPMRFTTAGEDTSAANDPLNTRLSPEVTGSVIWKLQPGDFYKLYIGIPGKGWEEKKFFVHQRMRDIFEGLITTEFAKRSPQKILEELHIINDALKERLDKELGKYGIDIDIVHLQSPDFSHGVSKALAKIAEAKATAKATIATAEAEKQTKILNGEGEGQARERLAEARRKELAAEGEGLADAAKALGMPGKDYRDGEIAKSVLNDKTIILGEAGITQAAAAAGVFIEGLKKKNDGEAKDGK